MNTQFLRSRPLQIALFAVLAAGFTAQAGPLLPNAGPVGSTYKTLTEVEPRIPLTATTTPGDVNTVFVITQPGSYYLTGNLSVASGKSGIKIAATGVTIDLCGFAIVGQSDSNCGILAESNARAACIHDGTILSMGWSGIAVGSSAGNTISNITIDSCGGYGISSGNRDTIQNCTVLSCPHGILTSHACIVRSCNASQCNLYGFSVYSGTLVDHCTAQSNPGTGFISYGASTFRGCIAELNQGDGFSTYDEETITDCVAHDNAGNGIRTGLRNRVDHCTVSDNASYGINCGSESRIFENYCGRNGLTSVAANIYCGSGTGRTHIEGNTCVSSDVGIEVDGTANMVIGNRCTLNTSNFEIAAGNRVGAIVVMPTSAAISGNSGGNSGVADSIANLAY